MANFMEPARVAVELIASGVTAGEEAAEQQDAILHRAFDLGVGQPGRPGSDAVMLVLAQLGAGFVGYVADNKEQRTPGAVLDEFRTRLMDVDLDS